MPPSRNTRLSGHERMAASQRRGNPEEYITLAECGFSRAVVLEQIWEGWCWPTGELLSDGQTGVRDSILPDFLFLPARDGGCGFASTISVGHLAVAEWRRQMEDLADDGEDDGDSCPSPYHSTGSRGQWMDMLEMAVSVLWLTGEVGASRHSPLATDERVAGRATQRMPTRAELARRVVARLLCY